MTVDLTIPAVCLMEVLGQPAAVSCEPQELNTASDNFYDLFCSCRQQLCVPMQLSTAVRLTAEKVKLINLGIYS